MKRSRGYRLQISELQKKRLKRDRKTDFIKVVAMEMIGPHSLSSMYPLFPQNSIGMLHQVKGAQDLEGKNQDLPSHRPLLNDDTVSHICVLKLDFIKPSDYLVKKCMFPVRLGTV